MEKDGKYDNRKAVECDLQFLALAVFVNSLKAKSRETISTLRNSNIRTIMSTGKFLFNQEVWKLETENVQEFSLIFQNLHYNNSRNFEEVTSQKVSFARESGVIEIDFSLCMSNLSLKRNFFRALAISM